MKLNWQHEVLLEVIAKAKQGDEQCVEFLRTVLASCMPNLEAENVIRLAETLRDIREDFARKHFEKN